jgi:dTDP-4-amino-4,6-dideoxygalactose transaminase
MSEFHAALGLNLLPFVASNIERRNRIADSYKKGLSRFAGISFQEISAGSKSTYKDFAILIDEDKFGLNRDELIACLEKENIMTRRYFYPPLHMQGCYPELRAESKTLPNTTIVSERVVCLPMFSDLADEQVRGIVDAIARIHEFTGEIRSVLRRKNR